jgi:hypothetical protein
MITVLIMTILSSLLMQGYFPQELPPVFNTESFAKLVSTKRQEDYTRPAKLSHRSAQLIKHDIPNLKLRRRITGIPNPLFYFFLCDTIENYWSNIQNHYGRSKLSRSKPSLNPNMLGRSMLRTLSENKLIDERLFIRSRSKYILKTDITRFYPSVYTHSIPWALHTKPVAKQHTTDSNYFGNILDRDTRNLQDGQTIGIPIGPDTSLIIAEIVLAAFDEQLLRNLPHLLGFRYVDDFELGFKTYVEAEEALGIIRELLKEFELEVNHTKTIIIDIPLELDSIWTGKLKNHQFNQNRQRADILEYIDNAVYLARLHPTDHVLKYAVKKLGSLEPLEENWSLIQNFLFQCLIAETSTFYAVLSVLQQYAKKYPIDQDQLEYAMNFHIQQNCSLNQTNEVCWALWASLYWNLQLEEKSVDILSKMENSLIALMTLNAEKRNLIKHGRLDKTKWETIVKEDNVLYSDQWLLAYEANCKGWLPFTKDYVSSDPNFDFLKSSKVSFYDENRRSVNLTGVSMIKNHLALFSFT